MIVCSNGVAAATLTLNSSDVLPLQVGDSLTLTIDVAEVSDLFAYNIDFLYDTNLLDLVSVNPGSFLPSNGTTLSDLGLFAFNSSVDGAITDINDSLLALSAGADGEGTLASLTFLATTPGTGALGFDNINIPAGTELVDSDGNSLLLSAASELSVVVVPIPAGIFLFASALAALLGWQRYGRH